MISKSVRVEHEKFLGLVRCALEGKKEDVVMLARRISCRQSNVVFAERVYELCKQHGFTSSVLRDQPKKDTDQ